MSEWGLGFRVKAFGERHKAEGWTTDWNRLTLLDCVRESRVSSWGSGFRV